jgi:lysophospholipase L1-like esterase
MAHREPAPRRLFRHGPLPLVILAPAISALIVYRTRRTRSNALKLLRAAATALGAAGVTLLTQLLALAVITPRLPIAPGPTEGRVAGSSSRLLRAVAFGDSVAAGTGCPSHEQAKAGSLGRGLADASGCEVEWHSVGHSGVTARQMCHPKQMARLRAVAAREGGVDAVSVSVGVNHILDGHSPTRFAAELREMLRAVRAVVGARCVVVVSGLPPMRRFPKVVSAGGPLPLLPWFMGTYVDALSAATARVCGEAEFRAGVHFLDIDFFNSMRLEGGKEAARHLTPTMPCVASLHSCT